MNMKIEAPGPGRSAESHRASAFTLVELLVVIAIIGVLAALLLPALSRGKALAHSTACRNELRQIGLTLSMYVSDHGRYPSLVGKGTNTWADRLYPSTPRHWTNSSWHCPTYIASKGVVSLEKLWTSYAYNGTGIFDGPWDSDKFQLGLGTRPRYSKSEPEVLVPSAMYTVADARAIKSRLGICGSFSMRPYVLLPFQDAGPLHGQGYNILFGDGHVALVKRNDYLFPPRTAHNWNRDNQPHPEAWAPTAYWAVHN